MHPYKAAEQFLRTHHIRDCTITVALSGGADSVCLLYCLLHVQKEMGLHIGAIHVQHGLRGEESRRDERFCRMLCEKWGVPLTVVRGDVQGWRRTHGGSVETAARECRYAAFAAHGGYIATAHTASDQFETMLFRLVRGSGLRGLCGIPPVREQYLRPLLTVSREEVEAFLREKALPFVTDSTNSEETYTRSYLRQRVVPLLYRVNPAAVQTAAQTAEILREEEDLLAQAAASAYADALQADGSLTGLAALHPALQRRCIRQFLTCHGLPAGLTQTEAVRALLRTGGRLALREQWVCVSHGTVFLQNMQNDAPQTVLHLGKNRIFSDVFVEASLILRSETEKFASVYNLFTDSVLDYDIIKEYATLHSRVPGLRMQPAGRTHHVSVKKWMNACVPPAKREKIHFLSDAQGLLWVEGLGVAAHAAVTPRTERMLLLRVSTA